MAIRNLTSKPYQRISENKDIKFIPTGISGLDFLLNDLESQGTTLITGRPGEGKSTLVHQTLLYAIDKGYTVLLLDGEHNQEKMIQKLYEKLIGSSTKLYDSIKYNKRIIKEPKAHIMEKLMEWHRDKLYIYSKDDNDLNDLDALFDYIELQVQMVKADLVIFDNLMSLAIAGNEDQNSVQSRFMKRCTRMDDTLNTHNILVAHPNKAAKKGQEIDIYDVLGNSELVNLATNVMVVGRDSERGKNAGYVDLIKNRDYGDLGKIKTVYSKKVSALCEVKGGEPILNKIDWRKEGEQEQWVPADDVPF